MPGHHHAKYYNTKMTGAAPSGEAEMVRTQPVSERGRSLVSCVHATLTPIRVHVGSTQLTVGVGAVHCM